MESDVPMSEQMSERGEQSERGSQRSKRSKEEHGGANERSIPLHFTPLRTAPHAGSFVSEKMAMY